MISNDLTINFVVRFTNISTRNEFSNTSFTLEKFFFFRYITTSSRLSLPKFSFPPPPLGMVGGRRPLFLFIRPGTLATLLIFGPLPSLLVLGRFSIRF